ncbi:PaREP1 family protein [Acidianus sp. HS-5]|uniref:PaREP1 family protein n=1 Tax=Acidianus sp. HS-5 TaxID=2886040 RepID=UPI001F378D8A|nr:PaREP1 family protein [Acidianus sp. HS-5]
MQIENWIKEANDLLSRGDVVQASEKYYKAAEEAIKLLTIRKNLNILRTVESQKRWTSSTLFEAAKNLGVYKIWHSAWYLHVFGFHEMILDKNDVEKISKVVKKILSLI